MFLTKRLYFIQNIFLGILHLLKKKCLVIISCFKYSRQIINQIKESITPPGLKVKQKGFMLKRR